jgi:chromosome partitioning protein
MIDGRTVGDIRPDSKSAKEISALWMYMRDRLARLYGPDPRWENKPRTDFSTTVLTPESAFEPQVAFADDGEDDWEADVPPWASVAANMLVPDPRQKAQQPQAQPQPSPRPQQIQIPALQPEAALAVAKPERNNLERRMADRGPPTGVADRRQPRTFGRRPHH